MDPLLFDDEVVRRNTTDKVYPRALGILEAQQFVQLVRRGDALDGVVWGTDVAPYRVRAEVVEDRRIGAVSCTYSFGG